MPIHAAAAARTLLHDDHRYHHDWLPAESPRNLVGKALLDVERSEQRLDVGDARLDLDHQQDSEAGVVREQIDPSSVAIDIEAHLRMDDPAPAFQPPLPEVRKRRVTRVQQLVE